MTPIREELEDWLRIPSVSTGGGDADALGRACDWVLERIEAAGGSAERVVVDGSNPMAVGELRASRDDAPKAVGYWAVGSWAVGYSVTTSAPILEPQP